MRTDVNLAGFGREFTGINKIKNQCIFGLCLRKNLETFFTDAAAALNFFRLRKLFVYHGLIFYVRTNSTLADASKIYAAVKNVAFLWTTSSRSKHTSNFAIERMPGIKFWRNDP